MRTFKPIFFGDFCRYRAICVGSRWFVADANVYDRQHNDRATVTHIGLLSSLPSLARLVCAVSGSPHYTPDKGIGWMDHESEDSLLSLYETRQNDLFGIMTFDRNGYL